MSVSAETTVNPPPSDFSVAERLLSRRKWPFADKLPLLQSFSLTNVSAQLVLERASSCLMEDGFSIKVNVEPGTQARLFYRDEPIFFGLMLSLRNVVRASDIERRKRSQSALWLLLFFGLAIIQGFVVSGPHEGGLIPWSYVPFIVFVPMPLEFVAIYFGFEILFSWWREQAVKIVYCGLRPAPSASTAVAALATEIRVWIFGGQVLAAGGWLGQWKQIKPESELEVVARKWRDTMTGAVSTRVS